MRMGRGQGISRRAGNAKAPGCDGMPPALASWVWTQFMHPVSAGNAHLHAARDRSRASGGGDRPGRGRGDYLDDVRSDRSQMKRPTDAGAAGLSWRWAWRRPVCLGEWALVEYDPQHAGLMPLWWGAGIPSSGAGWGWSSRIVS